MWVVHTARLAYSRCHHSTRTRQSVAAVATRSACRMSFVDETSISEISAKPLAIEVSLAVQPVELLRLASQANGLSILQSDHYMTIPINKYTPRHGCRRKRLGPEKAAVLGA